MNEIQTTTSLVQELERLGFRAPPNAVSLTISGEDCNDTMAIVWRTQTLGSDLCRKVGDKLVHKKFGSPRVLASEFFEQLGAAISLPEDFSVSKFEINGERGSIAKITLEVALGKDSLGFMNNYTKE